MIGIKLIHKIKSENGKFAIHISIAFFKVCFIVLSKCACKGNIYPIIDNISMDGIIKTICKTIDTSLK